MLDPPGAARCQAAEGLVRVWVGGAGAGAGAGAGTGAGAGARARARARARVGLGLGWYVMACRFRLKSRLSGPSKLGFAPTESISSAASASSGSRYTATTSSSCAPSCALAAVLVAALAARSPAVSAPRAASKVVRGAAIHTTGRAALARCCAFGRTMLAAQLRGPTRQRRGGRRFEAPLRTTWAMVSALKHTIASSSAARSAAACASGGRSRSAESARYSA